LIQVPGVFEGPVLGGPHLVLPHAGGHDGPGLGVTRNGLDDGLGLAAVASATGGS
jgi:hypothetical protein